MDGAGLRSVGASGDTGSAGGGTDRADHLEEKAGDLVGRSGTRSSSLVGGTHKMEVAGLRDKQGGSKAHR